MVPTHPILTNDHASAWLGIAVDRADFDDVLIRMTVREDMVNGFGTGQVLTAVGKVLTRTGRSGLDDVHVTTGETLVAEFRGRSRTIATAPAIHPASDPAPPRRGVRGLM